MVQSIAEQVRKSWNVRNPRCNKCGTTLSVKYFFKSKHYCNACILKESSEQSGETYQSIRG